MKSKSKEKKSMSGSKKRKREIAGDDEGNDERSNVAGKRVTRSSKEKVSTVSGGRLMSTPQSNVAGKRVTRSSKERASTVSGGRLMSTPERCGGGLDDERLPPKLFKVEKIPKKGRLNSYSKPDYLQTISDALRGTEELEWLKTTQFGSLFQIPVHMCGFSGKLVHNLLCRSVLTRRKHELWFVFAGYPIRYSLREFAMLTGLNCDPIPPTSEAAAVKKTHKGGDDNWKWLIGDTNECYVSEIAKMLEKDYHDGLGGKERMPVEKRLKLALVVLVDGILLCDSSKIFDKKYMSTSKSTVHKPTRDHQ